MLLKCVTLGLLLVASVHGDSKADLAPAETRVGPHFYGGVPHFVTPLEGYVAPVVEPALYAGPYEAEALTYGAGLGAGYGLVGKPIIGGPYLGGGYKGGFVKSGLNEGALALGNKGEQIYKESIDGGFKDGIYHHGGGFKNGGYQGVEAYNDNKHHLADDHANKLYYSGVRGGKSDLGNGEIYDKNQEYAVNAYNALGDNQLKGYQKGHKKTGFHKSYHKDESGNDETYYDSDHDEGNYEFGKKYGDKYGNNFLSGVTGAKKFNEYTADEEAKKGYIGNGKLIAHNQGFKDYYGKNGYYNNADHYGGSGGIRNSELAKIGYNHGFQNGFNNGKNYAGFQNAKFGGGYYGPY
ncbi:hypothetical protein RUM43_012806 [Polyplax serrata]|uniref:Uncharacterized protein n=1 Tax=Polyplax serrata TaxID=468196 RepID=A0AAN8PJK9_POLSC